MNLAKPLYASNKANLPNENYCKPLTSFSFSEKLAIQIKGSNPDYEFKCNSSVNEWACTLYTNFVKCSLPDASRPKKSHKSRYSTYQLKTEYIY